MRNKQLIQRFVIGAIWLALWQLAAVLVANQILLAGPFEVLSTLAIDIQKAAFWSSIGLSFVRIGSGFLLAFVLGLAVGAFAARFSVFADFLEPAIQVLKSVPIVCFIVLLLVWFGSLFVSAIAVFLVVFPAVYAAMLEGLRQRDPKRAELLYVYQVGPLRAACIYHWPATLPFLLAASRVAVGMAWKSGIAAELIGLPLGSIGEHIYHAKLTLSCAELFAWTVVVVLLSLVCERVFLLLLRCSKDWLWRAALPRSGAEVRDVAGSSLEDGVDGRAAGAQRTNADDLLDVPLRLEDISIAFDQIPLFAHLNLSLEPGGRYAVRGPSGSGKTTLLALVGGLRKPDGGVVSDGPSDPAGRSVRCAFVFQEARLFEEYSALENVQMLVGRFVAPERIAAELAALLPASSLNKPVSELSGGMRRRVELVRAALYPSHVLALDEPFAGLDDESHRAAQDFLLSRLHGRILLLATHDEADEQALGLVPFYVNTVFA